MRYICGIDSGKQGALVVIGGKDSSAAKVIWKYIMPLKGKDLDLDELCRLIDLIQLTYKPLFVLEQLQPIHGAGKGSQFSMAQTFGTILGMLHCTGVNYVLVRPKNWQGIVISSQDVVYKDPNAKRKVRDTKRKVRDTKQTALNAAERLYPNLDLRYGDNEARRGKDRRTKQHGGLVDALLIAYSQL